MVLRHVRISQLGRLAFKALIVLVVVVVLYTTSFSIVETPDEPLNNAHTTAQIQNGAGATPYPSAQNRIAICLSGSVRFYRQTWKSWYLYATPSSIFIPFVIGIQI
jgi:hypothetical protein